MRTTTGSGATTPAEVLLLPPSEGKAEGGTGRWRAGSGSFGALGQGRRQVAGAVQAAAAVDPAKVLGLTGTGLARAQQRCAEGWIGSPALPGWARYTGVVHEHLDLAGMAPGDRDAAAARIWVPSGLLGLVALSDPVPEYRCKAGLRVPLDGRLQPCGVWWQPQVTAAIVARRPARLIELLTNEHRRMLDLDAIAGAGTEVIALEFVRADGRGAAGHGAKAAKGRLARSILEDGLDAVLTQLHDSGRVVSQHQDGRVTRWAITAA